MTAKQRGFRCIRDRLRAALNFSPSAHVPLICDGTPVGWLRHAAAQRLAAWPEVFKRDAAGMRIAESPASPAARTAALDGIVDELRREGAVTGWRNERYAVVTAFGRPALFHIERAAARYFGVTTYAAHANGYCGGGAACEMWLARRSADKPIDPGMLDNLVGGGMSVEATPHDTIVREAWEEAGIPAQLAGAAVPAGTVRLLRTVPEGVQSELIFVHDLELPRRFEPRNQDGEVCGFSRVLADDIAGMLDSGVDVTLDASLVMLSFLLRRGYIALERGAAAGILEFT